jgi:hypothetical protein
MCLLIVFTCSCDHLVVDLVVVGVGVGQQCVDAQSAEQCFIGDQESHCQVCRRRGRCSRLDVCALDSPALGGHAALVCNVCAAGPLVTVAKVAGDRRSLVHCRVDGAGSQRPRRGAANDRSPLLSRRACRVSAMCAPPQPSTCASHISEQRWRSSSTMCFTALSPILSCVCPRAIRLQRPRLRQRLRCNRHQTSRCLSHRRNRKAGRRGRGML